MMAGNFSNDVNKKKDDFVSFPEKISIYTKPLNALISVLRETLED